MRGLSLVGLLVGLGVAGVLMANQIKPSPETGKSMPVENIEKANGAAQTMENQAEQLQEDMQQLN